MWLHRRRECRRMSIRITSSWEDCMNIARELSICVALSAAAFAGAGLGSQPARAGDIIAEWASVKPPPVPGLKPVTLDGKTTALLILDMMKSNCGARPRCG